MKKILILALLMAPIISLADEPVLINGVEEPQWKDFAPKAYVNIEEPKGVVGKLNETAKYWYKRKVAFDKAINECRSLSDEEGRFTCYQKVKVKQYQENSDYNARLEAEEQARRMPQEMQDRTDTMLPISDYINSFSRFQPNELRGY